MWHILVSSSNLEKSSLKNVLPAFAQGMFVTPKKGAGRQRQAKIPHSVETIEILFLLSLSSWGSKYHILHALASADFPDFYCRVL